MWHSLTEQVLNFAQVWSHQVSTIRYGLWLTYCSHFQLTWSTLWVAAYEFALLLLYQMRCRHCPLFILQSPSSITLPLLVITTVPPPLSFGGPRQLHATSTRCSVSSFLFVHSRVQFHTEAGAPSEVLVPIEIYHFWPHHPNIFW